MNFAAMVRRGGSGLHDHGVAVTRDATTMQAIMRREFHGGTTHADAERNVDEMLRSPRMGVELLRLSEGPAFRGRRIAEISRFRRCPRLLRFRYFQLHRRTRAFQLEFPFATICAARNKPLGPVLAELSFSQVSEIFVRGFYSILAISAVAF